MESYQEQASPNLFEGLKKLTPRECEILELVGEGKTNAEIADELFLSIRTVENHRYHICKKLDLKGRGALDHWCKTIIMS